MAATYTIVHFCNIIGIRFVSVLLIVLVRNGRTGAALPGFPSFQGSEQLGVIFVGRLGVVDGFLGLQQGMLL